MRSIRRSQVVHCATKVFIAWLSLSAVVSPSDILAQETLLVTVNVSGPSGPLENAPVRAARFSLATGDELPDVLGMTSAEGIFAFSTEPAGIQFYVEPPPGTDLADDRTMALLIEEDADVRFELAEGRRIRGRVILPEGVDESPTLFARGLGRGELNDTVAPGGEFEFFVSSDVYSIGLQCPAAWCSRYYYGVINVDARAEDIDNLVIPLVEGEPPILPVRPPVASLISVGSADADGIAEVSGSVGAAEPLSAILVANAGTGQYTIGVSEVDGSFSASMFAPPGSMLIVRHDPTGRYPRGDRVEEWNAAPGTVLRAPITPIASGVSISGTSGFHELGLEGISRHRVIGAKDPGQLHISGSIDRLDLSAGEPFQLAGRFDLRSSYIDQDLDPATVSIVGTPMLTRIIHQDGSQMRSQARFHSWNLTPTGLPIQMDGHATHLSHLEVEAFSRVAENHLTAEWDFNRPLPADIPDGIYRLTIGTEVEGIESGGAVLDTFPTVGSQAGDVLALIRVGTTDAPRLRWVLGMDWFSNGARGIVPVEERDEFQVAPTVMTNSDLLVLPKDNPRTGEPISYWLEPHVPVASNQGYIPFELPSGSLRVVVRKPDGSEQTIGPVQFKQNAFRTPITRGGEFPGGGSNFETDFIKLHTGNGAFHYEFDQFGPYEIEMTGFILDEFGNRFEGGGTYPLMIGRHLDLEPGVMPGTPFEVGDALVPTVVIQPPVPARVEVRVTLPANNDGQHETTTLHGTANRFGYFAADPVVFDREGEYRVDIAATFTDTDGIPWSGSAIWGSVVESPNQPIITHGRRGFDGVDDIQDQWFLLEDIRGGQGHVMLPFHTGDVMWMSQDGPDADVLKISLQDAEGSFADRVRSAADRDGDGFHEDIETPGLEQRIVAGEIPLYSTTPAPLDPTFIWEEVDQFGYFYAHAERPGVRVREITSEDESSNAYWRFQDNYNFQLGNGVNGDLENDFKFQFGGAVYRDLRDGFSYYGAYGSLFVLLPHGDEIGGRIFPPFQGAAGGPSGGPIMTLKGEEIDLFFHPTGVRPGSILVRGNRASFSGQVGPTLAAKIEIEVASPSGQLRTIEGQANKIGYFYDPDQDLVVDEIGVWTATVSVWFDGMTSAGQVGEPFPSGNVLGSDGGVFRFYVVDTLAPPLEIEVSSDTFFESPTGNRFVRPAEGTVTVAIAPPEEITDAELHFTTVMPGFLLEQGSRVAPLASSSSPFTYTYDAVALHQDFPNLDLLDGDGFAGVDTITLSFLVTGTGASGETLAFPRQIVLQGEELLGLDQEADDFVINAGVNGAWFNAETPGQGFFMEVFPDIRQMFVAWFTYDTASTKAQVGDDNHRWLTAQGPFDGKTGNLDVFVSRGGLFDDPASVSTAPDGSLTVTFTDCATATVDYALTSADLSGSVPIGRLALDNLNLCQGMDGVQKRVAPVIAGEDGFQINSGLSGAWFNPSTPGQGFMLEVYPEINLVFLSWFTYDTAEPDAGAMARVGDAGQRWLTAQGPYQGDGAALEVSLTVGGLFDDPAPVTSSPAGTINLTFQDCGSGTLEYDLTGAGLSGSVPISRLSDDNVGLCEALEAAAESQR